MTPSSRVPGREALALQGEEAGQRAEARRRSGRSNVARRSGRPAPRRMPSRHALFPIPLGRRNPRQHRGARRVGRPPSPSLGVAGRVAREPRPRGRPEHAEADLHPLVERMPLPRAARGRGEACGCCAPRGSRSVSRDRPSAGPRRGRVDRDHVGRQLLDQPGETVEADPRHDAQRDAPLVEQHEIEALADADVDPQRAHGRRLRPALASEELEEVAPGQDAERLARPWSRRGPRCVRARERHLDRRVPLHHRDRRAPSPRRRRTGARPDRGTPAPAARGRGSTRRTATRRSTPRGRPAPARSRAPAGSRRPGAPCRARSP